MKMMEVILWIHDGKCRLLLKKDGVVIYTNDRWNNRASAEEMILEAVPEASLRFVGRAHKREIKKLNVEWDAVLPTVPRNG